MSTALLRAEIWQGTPRMAPLNQCLAAWQSRFTLCPSRPCRTTWIAIAAYLGNNGAKMERGGAQSSGLEDVGDKHLKMIHVREEGLPPKKSIAGVRATGCAVSEVGLAA